MTFDEKIKQLRGRIEDMLLPLIDGDYVLWDCPYHNNIGDILIWQGEIEFLQKLKYRCWDYASIYTCSFPKLSEDVVILLHGGGNFGDVWRDNQDFRIEVCKRYPNNKIIVFPQTVFYENREILSADAELFSKHNNLFICARDEYSYQVLKRDFKNQILLLPDMAFCISTIQAERTNDYLEKKVLYLKRSDKELGGFSYNLPENVEEHDWPTFEKKYFIDFVMDWSIRFVRHFKIPFLMKWVDYIALKIYRKVLIKVGRYFLMPYTEIYTTRLHVFILGILLHKPCHVIDNNYGKNSHFYLTWLKDLEFVDLFKQSTSEQC